MSDEDYNLDMTMMYAVHHALRRDLERLARLTAGTEDDPRHVLRSAVGWEMFKSFLRVHHTAEDDSVWEVMRGPLAGHPDEIALLDAMEAEHAQIDPLLAAVDAALVDRDHGPGILGDAVDELTRSLTAHLSHEEDQALRLIDATMTLEQWKHFSDDHRQRIGDDAVRYLPWLLDDADPRIVSTVLDRMPDALRQAYADEWRAAYLDLRPWNPEVSSTD